MRSDDQLKNQLEAANPSPSNAPLDPYFLARIRARIQEKSPMTMNTPTRPKWFPYAIAAGAAAVVALGIGAGLAVTGDDTVPAASEAPPTTPASTTAPPTTIGKVVATVDRPAGLEPAPVVEGIAMMSCLPFSAESISGALVAFDGVVTAVEGTDVTFEVTTWFRGGSGDILVTDGIYMSDDNTTLIGGPPAEVGQRYLVAAELYSDAVRPGACGRVQPYSAEMATTYAAAFAV